MKREKAGSRTGICLVIIIGNASLYFGTLEEEFQWAIFFFRGFLLRGPIRKSGSWRSAAGVHIRLRPIHAPVSSGAVSSNSKSSNSAGSL
jgi:hypothetical protein